jgi:hypothetical protein
MENNISGEKKEENNETLKNNISNNIEQEENNTKENELFFQNKVSLKNIFLFQKNIYFSLIIYYQ